MELLQQPSAERVHKDAIRIRWRGEDARASASVYVGTDPGAMSGDLSGRVVAGKLQAGEVILQGLDPRTRHFFRLDPGGGLPSRVIAERLMPFEGAHNFRDLGGYETTDGRRVRWGKIYRSDHLAELTEQDLAYFSELGIRLVCDFRRDGEIAKQPNRMPQHDPPMQINPSVSGTSLLPNEIEAAIRAGNPGQLDFRRLLIDGNRFMVTEALDQYRTLMRSLEREECVPLLFHCTAGKDRTGVGAALILLALGVPEEIVMHDYLLTATYTHDRVERMLAGLRFDSHFRVDADEIRPLMSVRREFLQAALDAIRDKFGSVDHYMDQALLLNEERRDSLRSRLLE
ncbi:MAG: tyrosine-protein phosphatase [Myxococcales bacterium]|nr:tyrosine-protein phosphatase [Myxococcales bacterium]